jgi:hypothetical protein
MHTDDSDDAVVLDEPRAARRIAVSVHYLRASRLDPPRCDGPPFVKLGRAIRYRIADLDAFVAARVVRAVQTARRRKRPGQRTAKATNPWPHGGR